MKKRKPELKPDIVLKNYWRNNEQFADLFNALLFDGKQMIEPEELTDIDSEESLILEHKKYAESVKASRDNIKVRKNSAARGVEFMMLGMESQSHIHYAMPMRVMGYDYSAYQKQYASNAVKCQNGKELDADEYLSKMKKTDKFKPVITAVVYYGEEPWDGAVTLHGMLDIPQEVEPYVNDYRMLLIQARNSLLNFHDKRNKDFFHLLEIILDRTITRKEAKERAISYCEEHNTEKSVLMAVAGAANAKIDYHAFEKGEGKMCTLFEEIAEEGRVAGRKEGRLEGRKEGRLEGREEGRMEGRKEGRAVEIIETGIEFELQDSDIIERLQRKLEISLQKAEEYFRQFSGQRV